MKTLFISLATVLVLGSCASNGQNNSGEDANDSLTTHISLVKPLESNINLDSLQNATLHVSFTADSFNWMGGNLTMTVYAETVYDSLQVQKLAKGDSIIYDGRTIVVDYIINEGDYLTINDGYSENGLDLQSLGNGTYRASIEDDYSVYIKIGETELPLADDFTINDCGDNPTDEPITITSDQKLYIENLKDYHREFSNLNTTIVVKDGMITNIRRIWVP